MSDNKKSPWLIVLTIAKYAIAVIIGALGGNTDTVTNILTLKLLYFRLQYFCLSTPYNYTPNIYKSFLA